MKHIFLLGGQANSFITFRKGFINALISRGWRITAAASGGNSAVQSALAAQGVEYVALPLARSGMNPLKDLETLKQVRSAIRRARPDIVFTYTHKPNIIGLIAAALEGVPRRVAMVEGLGYAFTPGSELRRTVARLALTMAMRVAFRLADRLVVLNIDDLDFFRSGRYMSRRADVVLLPGTGVDLDYFAAAPTPAEVDPVTFVLLTRLLKDKGVLDYVEAARIAHRTKPELVFLLTGPEDPNANGISAEVARTWTKEGLVDYLGTIPDQRMAIRRAHVVVAPTYYREGLPATIMEGSAMGRAIITTDVPGCRDALVSGENGLVVPPRNPQALAAAMLQLAQDRDLLSIFGARSRRYAEDRYSGVKLANQLVDYVEGDGGALV